MDLKTAKNIYKQQLKMRGQSLVDRSIGIMVATIVIGAVAVPVIQDVINESNLSGTAGMVLEYVPLGLVLSLFIAAISIIRR